MTEFLVSNWLWIALLVAMFTMHRHRGCAMHRRTPAKVPHHDTEHPHHIGSGRSTT